MFLKIIFLLKHPAEKWNLRYEQLITWSLFLISLEYPCVAYQKFIFYVISSLSTVLNWFLFFKGLNPQRSYRVYSYIKKCKGKNKSWNILTTWLIVWQRI